MKLIKNATIFWENKVQNHMNILYDQHIYKITENFPEEKAEVVIDATDQILIPGCIDAHVHFNDPGYTHHEDFSTGTKAAAAGGITTIIDMPCTSIPPVTNNKNLEKKLQEIQKKAYVDFSLWGGIRANDETAEIEKLWENGIVGFKMYTISGMETFPALSYDQISDIFKIYPEYLFAFHAEDQQTIGKNLRNRKITEKNYSEIRSVEAELIAVKKVLQSASEQNKIHFVHISSKKAADWIEKQKLNQDVSWETCPHYLQFTNADFFKLRGRLKTAPPVKTEEDRAFLREQLLNGRLDFVTTDHAGCNYKTEKELTDFADIYNGIPGTQLMVPYLFSEFYSKTSLSRLIELTSEKAAKRYGLYPKKGSLQIGTDADFTIINPNKKWKVDENKLNSKGKYSPFNEKIFNAEIEKTIVRGEIIYSHNDGIIGKKGFGTWIKRS